MDAASWPVIVVGAAILAALALGAGILLVLLEIAAKLQSVAVRTLTEITLLCAERPKPQKTGSAWMHLATLYRSLSLRDESG